jgi:hypothetical protein
MSCKEGYVGNFYDKHCSGGSFKDTEANAMCYAKNQTATVNTQFTATLPTAWTAVMKTDYRNAVIAAAKVTADYVGQTMVVAFMTAGSTASVTITSSSKTYQATGNMTNYNMWTPKINYTGTSLAAAAKNPTTLDVTGAQAKCTNIKCTDTKKEPILTADCGPKWMCDEATCCQTAKMCSSFSGCMAMEPYTAKTTKETCSYGVCTMAECCQQAVNGVTTLTPVISLIWGLVALAFFV